MLFRNHSAVCWTPYTGGGAGRAPGRSSGIGAALAWQRALWFWRRCSAPLGRKFNCHEAAVDGRLVAESRQCRFQFARRNPDTRRGQRTRYLLKLSGHLDRPLLAESRHSRFQIARRKPVIHRSPERKIWTAPPTAAHGRVEAKQVSNCSPQTGHPAESTEKNLDGTANGRSWPSRAKVGFNLLAANRSSSGVQREKFGRHDQRQVMAASDPPTRNQGLSNHATPCGEAPPPCRLKN
jgi:hypothetical protein